MWAGHRRRPTRRPVGDIGHAVESYVRRAPTAYGIVEEYTGHGIGTAMHQPPDVPNLGRRRHGASRWSRAWPGHRAHAHRSARPGHSVLDDEWTVVTGDGSLAATGNTPSPDPRRRLGAHLSRRGRGELAEIGAPFGPLAE